MRGRKLRGRDRDEVAALVLRYFRSRAWETRGEVHLETRGWAHRKDEMLQGLRGESLRYHDRIANIDPEIARRAHASADRAEQSVRDSMAKLAEQWRVAGVPSDVVASRLDKLAINWGYQADEQWVDHGIARYPTHWRRELGHAGQRTRVRRGRTARHRRASRRRASGIRAGTDPGDDEPARSTTRVDPCLSQRNAAQHAIRWTRSPKAVIA